MSELKERLDNLRALMQEPEFLEGKGLSNEVNIRIFCYDPSDEMMVRHFIEQIMTDQSMNCHLIEHNLYEVFLSICEDKRIAKTIPAMEEKKGKELVDSMKKEVEKVKAIGDKIADKKNVYFEIGAGSGLYTFGNGTFLNELIETVGAKNIFGNESSWITVTPEAVIDANPDVILVNTPGTNEAGLTAIEDVESRDGWDTITAVQNGAVYSIDNNASSRPSQNVIKALKEIAKAIYPDEYKEL